MKLTHFDEESEKTYRVAQILDHFKIKWKLKRLVDLYRHQGHSSLDREIIADRIVDTLKSEPMIDTKSIIRWLDKRLKMYDV